MQTGKHRVERGAVCDAAFGGGLLFQFGHHRVQAEVLRQGQHNQDGGKPARAIAPRRTAQPPAFRNKKNAQTNQRQHVQGRE